MLISISWYGDMEILNEFNLVLFGKWYWRIFNETKSMWYRILNAWYGEEEGECVLGSRGGSVWWRNF